MADAERGLLARDGAAAAQHQHERLDRVGGALAAALRRAQHRRLLRRGRRGRRAARAPPPPRPAPGGARGVARERHQPVERARLHERLLALGVRAHAPRPRGTPPPAPRAPRTRAARRAGGTRPAPPPTPAAAPACGRRRRARGTPSACASARGREVQRPRRAGAPRARAAARRERASLRRDRDAFCARRRSARRRRRSARRSASSRGCARTSPRPRPRVVATGHVCRGCRRASAICGRAVRVFAAKSSAFLDSGDQTASSSSWSRHRARGAQNLRAVSRRHGGRVARHAAHAAPRRRERGGRAQLTNPGELHGCGALSTARRVAAGEHGINDMARSATRSFRRGAFQPAAWRRSASRSPPASPSATAPSRGCG